MTTTAKDATKKLIEEFDAVVDQTQQLLKSVAGAGTDQAGALRADLEESLCAATERLARIQSETLTQVKTAANATDEYVHGNPWQAVGVVAAASALAGLFAGLYLGRR